MSDYRGTNTAESLEGSASDDVIYGGGNITAPFDLSDTLLGGMGNDWLYGNGGADILFGQSGRDSLFGGIGRDTVYGGDGITDIDDDADMLSGGPDSDLLYGNAGNDLLFGNNNRDILFGGLGNDSLWGGDETDSPGDGGDILYGGPGTDILRGGYGNDTLYGGSGELDPSDIQDTLYGGDGDDLLFGNAGNDMLHGGNGNDTIYGGLGNNILIGGDGNDVFISASPGDVIEGGAGIDEYVFDIANLARLSAFGGEVESFANSDFLIHIRQFEEGETIRLLNGGDIEINFSLAANGTALRIGNQNTVLLEDVFITSIADRSINNQANTERSFQIGSSGDASPPNRFSADFTEIIGFTEDAAQLLPAITIEDSNQSAEEATLTLTLQNTAAGSFNTPAAGTVTSSYDAGTGTWQASGEIADLHTVLSTLTFTPTANYDQDVEVSLEVTGDSATSFEGSFTLRATPVNNDAPIIDAGISDQAATAGQLFSFTVPEDSFADPDTGDNLTLSAQLVGGGALPGWLSFNAGTQSFSGTAPGSAVGTLSLEVIATDGTANTVSESFDLAIANDLRVSNSDFSQNYTEDAVLDFTDIVISTPQTNVTATLTLSDTAAGTLSTATSGAVTSTYDAGTGIWQASGALEDVNILLAGLSFTPVANYEQDLTLAVQITDGVDTVNDTATLPATPVNDAPTVDQGLLDQFIAQADALSYSFAADAFADIDAGNSFTYSATLVDGSALPGWLSLDSATRTFSIGAGAGSVGSYDIRVTATDSGGASVTSDFQLGIAINSLLGTANAETINGTAAEDIIILLEDNDYGYGKADNDTLYGNEGQDRLYGGADDDTLYGGDDRDYLYGDHDGGSSGNDLLYGEAGDDYLYGDTNASETGQDTLYGGSGIDRLYGYGGNDILYGEADTDFLYGGEGDDRLEGGAGNDDLQGDEGADTLNGGEGDDDFLFYNPILQSPDATPDVIEDFTQGEDRIWVVGYNGIQSGAPSGTTLGYSFDGTYTTVTSADGFTTRLLGEYTLTAADFQFLALIGTNGNDTLTGGSGIDGILGLEGDDVIDGGRGADLIWGDDGNDTIDGGLDGGQQDTIYGGAGNDVFLLYVDPANERINSDWDGPDLIMDFVRGEDKIDVSRIPITSVVTGNASAARFDQLYVEYDATADFTRVTWEPRTYGIDAMRIQVKGNLALDDSDFIFGTHTEGTAAGEIINGTADDDNIIAYEGDDTINAGDGNDIISAEDGNNRVILGDGNDHFYSGAGDDTVIGGSGNDYILTGSGNNLVFFGEGNDYAYNPGSGTIFGGDGNDQLRPQGQDTKEVYGEAGNDTVFVWYPPSAGQFGDGGIGNDSIYVRGNNATVSGGYGRDRYFNYTSTAYRETILIEDPNESTSAETDYFYVAGNYYFDAGAEASADLIIIHGFTGMTEGMGTAVGTTLEYYYDGTNTIIKSSADYSFQMIIQGDYTSADSDGDGEVFDIANNFDFRGGVMGTMNDDNGLASTAAGEFLFGLEGSDTINGGNGDDSIFGGHDADTLNGEGGADSLSGGYANDTLEGGSGAAADTMEGGSGDDTFIFRNLTDSTATDTDVIIDFKHEGDADRIDLSALGATGIGAGANELTIEWLGGQYTSITINGTGFELYLQGYYESGTHLTNADFIF